MDPFAEQLASRRDDDEVQLAMDSQRAAGMPSHTAAVNSNFGSAKLMFRPQAADDNNHMLGLLQTAAVAAGEFSLSSLCLSVSCVSRSWLRALQAGRQMTTCTRCHVYITPATA